MEFLKPCYDVLPEAHYKLMNFLEIYKHSIPKFKRFTRRFSIMKANTVYLLLTTLIPLSFGTQFNCVVEDTKVSTDQLEIDTEIGVVKFLVGTGYGAMYQVFTILGNLRSGSAFQANEVNKHTWKVIDGIYHTQLITEGKDTHYAQFKYGLTKFENADDVNMQAFREKALSIHNKYRTRHGVDPIRPNNELDNTAQMHANLLARMNIVHLSAHSDEESIKYWNFQTSRKRPVGAKAAEFIEEWYNTGKKHYKFEIGSVEDNERKFCRYFAAMICKGISELGIGVAYGKTRHEGNLCQTMYIVAQYTGKVKWDNQYLSDNVMPEVNEEK